MNCKNCLLSFAIIFLLASCELGTELTLRTSKKSNGSITIYADSDFLPNTEKTSGTKIIFSLPINSPMAIYDTTLYYGIGGWNENRITDLTNKIDSIIIKNSNSLIKVKSKKEVKDFLKSNKTKGWNEKILIETN